MHTEYETRGPLCQTLSLCFPRLSDRNDPCRPPPPCRVTDTQLCHYTLHKRMSYPFNSSGKNNNSLTYWNLWFKVNFNALIFFPLFLTIPHHNNNNSVWEKKNTKQRCRSLERKQAIWGRWWWMEMVKMHHQNLSLENEQKRICTSIWNKGWAPRFSICNSLEKVFKVKMSKYKCALLCSHLQPPKGETKWFKN